MDKIAVLIPCYNESKTIKKVVEDFKRELPDATIYVYDNCSQNNTAEIAKNAGAVVRREPQKGKGNVIRRMFREIDARCYIMADGDDTYPAEYAKEMAEQVLNQNMDMVVGHICPQPILRKTKDVSIIAEIGLFEKQSICCFIATSRIL